VTRRWCGHERQHGQQAPVPLVALASRVAVHRTRVPFYNSVEPTLGGVPFFYWYQFLWLFITSGLIIFLYYRAE
jgi:hypothetical protein